MGSNVLVSLFVTVVLSNVVEVISADNDGSSHLLGRHDDTTEDTTANGNISGEGALLVNVVSIDGGLGSLVTETYIFIPSEASSSDLYGVSKVGRRMDIP